MKQIRLTRNRFYLESSISMSYDDIFELMDSNSSFLAQYLTPKTFFGTYVSRSERNLPSYLQKYQQIVLRFKEGEEIAQRRAAKKVSSFLRKSFRNRQDLVFVCVPAHSEELQRLRYEMFSAEICKRTGLQNGYSLVSVTSSRSEVHHGGSRETKNYELSSSLKGKKVVLFDDVETTGRSFARFAADLEALGAEVIQGCLLARAESFRCP